jgi:hypothetical protein
MRSAQSFGFRQITFGYKTPAPCVALPKPAMFGLDFKAASGLKIIISYLYKSSVKDKVFYVRFHHLRKI